MARIVSFEGCMGAGKTTLANYFSDQLGLDKLIEHSHANPFLHDFYSKADVKLETELTFLMLHYSLLKNVRSKDGIVLADFSLEKDLVFARMNLSQVEFDIFNRAYDFVVGSVGIPDLVIYIDLPFDTIAQRIKQRGRVDEVNTEQTYFEKYNDLLKLYFTTESKSTVTKIDGNQIKLNYEDANLNKIKEIIQSFRIMR